MNAKAAAAPDDLLRAQLARTLDWGEAHVAFDKAAKGVPLELQGLRPPGFEHSAWQLLEHIRRAQDDILEFCINANYIEKNWPEDYWPKDPVPPAPDAWEKSLAAIRSDREKLKALALDSTRDLLATIPHGSGQTYLREILLVTSHNAYHLGQLVAVRRALGDWNT